MEWPSIWIFLTLLLTAGYAGLIFFYYRNWKRLPTIPLPKEDMDWPLVTVIVVGRDEEMRIQACLESILENDYPPARLECIYMDDHSTDHSLSIVRENFSGRVRIIELKNCLQEKPVVSYKKEAIRYACEMAEGELILQTDADVRVPHQWILHHASGYTSRNAFFQAAPVFIYQGQGFLAAFQQYDFLVTMGITGAGIASGMHYMANGANMSFSRALASDHLTGRSAEYASGDDMFLVEAASLRDPSRVHFIKNPAAAVYTYPENSVSSFFRQRFRWAGKTGAYRSPVLRAVTAGVFAVNAWTLILVTGAFATTWIWWLLAGHLLVKWMADLAFILMLKKYYRQTISPIWVLPSLLFYPVYYLITGLSVFIPGRKILWKGRPLK